jgi:hypothetical protein
LGVPRNRHRSGINVHQHSYDSKVKDTIQDEDFK